MQIDFFQSKDFSPDYLHSLNDSPPYDGNCLFYSVVLSFMLPVLSNEEQFNFRLELLFGSLEESDRSTVKNLLDNYDGKLGLIKNSILTTLINNKLRFRIAAVMGSDDFKKSNPLSFNNLVGQNVDEYITKLTTSDTWGGEPEIIALSSFLNVNIEIRGYRNPIVYRSESALNSLVLVYTSAGDKIHDVKNHYRYAISPQYIPNINVKKLVPQINW